MTSTSPLPTTSRKPARNRFAWVLLILAAGALGSWWIAARADREMREDLLTRARIAADAVDVQRIQALHGTEADVATPGYLQLKDQFAAVRTAEPRCRFVYLMGRQADGTVFFFADSEPVGSEDESPAGQIYEDIPAEFLPAFDTKIELVEGPVSDRWGTWISALVPLTDPRTGELIAVLGMDIVAGGWSWDVAARAALPVGLVLLVMIGCTVALMASGRPGREEAELKPVQRRMLVPLTATLLLLFVGFGVLLTAQYRSHQQETNMAVLSESVKDLDRALEDQAAMLEALEDVILRDEGLPGALAAGDKERLQADWQPLYEKLRQAHGITHFYFHGPDRVNLLRVHKPEKNGDLIDRFTALEAERTGRTASGIELGSMGTFTLRAVRPVLDGETLLGYLELGKEIEDALSGIHRAQHVELAVAIHKPALNRKKWESGMVMLGRDADWDRFRESVLIYSSLSPLPATCERFIEETGHEHLESDALVEFGEKQWHVLVSPLRDVSGSEVGDLIILRDVSVEAAAFRRLLAAGAPLGILALAGLIAFLLVTLRRTDAGIREQQETLRESKARFDQLAEQSRTFTWEVDANGLYTYADHTVATVLGYEPEELVGKMYFYDLHPEEGRGAFKAAALDSFARKGTFRGLENQIETKAGEILWIVTNGMPLLDPDGTLRGYRGQDTDITERKRAEDEFRDTLAETSRMNRLMGGREDRILELKAEVNELLQKMDLDSKYRSVP